MAHTLHMLQCCMHGRAEHAHMCEPLSRQQKQHGALDGEASAQVLRG